MNYKEETLKIIREEFENAQKRKEEELQYLQGWSYDTGRCICVFGAGLGGNAVYTTYAELGIKIDFFCDNDTSKWGKTFWGGIECISLDELIKIKDNVLCVISVGTKAMEEIYVQLLQLGFREIMKHSESQLFLELVNEKSDFSVQSEEIVEKMREVFEFVSDELSQKVLYYRFKYLITERSKMNNINFGDIFSMDQYFLEKGKYLTVNEKIIDCGAYDGDTLEYLLKKINYQNFANYICYELNPETYVRLKKNIERYPETLKKRIITRPYGVAGRRTTVKVGENEEMEGQLDTLDSIEKQEGITFLKMDIEGFELESLEGATKLIKRDKPQCAICVYHKISDMWTIPIYLHKLLPEYRIIFRHHQYSYSETVCYALRREI